MAGVNTVTEKMNQMGYNIEMVRGDGYHYFIIDDPENNIYECESIMVPRFRSYSVDHWVQMGIDFYNKIHNVIS